MHARIRRREDFPEPDGPTTAVMAAEENVASIPFSAFSPSWSPAGDLIAFGVGRYFRAPNHPAAQLAVMKADGTPEIAWMPKPPTRSVQFARCASSTLVKASVKGSAAFVLAI